MRKKLLPLVLFLLLPQFALAQEEPTYIRVEPQPVRANQPFEIVVGGIFPGIAPPPPAVRFEPGRIVLTLPATPGGPLIDVPWGERIRIDGLAAGEYVIDLNGLGRTLSRYSFTVYESPFSVTPFTGRGGSEVMIEGIGFECNTTPCTLPVVSFAVRGGPTVVSPRVRIAPDGQIIAEVPAGLGARNDVIVQTASRTVTLPYGYADLGSIGSEPEEETHDIILLPLVFEGRGAHGSDWRTEITIRNDAPVAIDLNALRLNEPAPRLAPGDRLRVPPQGPRGLLLMVPRGLGKWLTFSSHVVDRSRTASNRGTEIPVVGTDDMAPVIRLLDVPLTPRFRAHLRVYSVDREENVVRHVTVVARKQDGSEVIEFVPIRWELDCGIAGCAPESPMFGSVDLSAIPALANAGPVDLTIYGQTNDERLWAFVSVTNNETQRVTLWTPQHDNQTAGVAR